MEEKDKKSAGGQRRHSGHQQPDNHSQSGGMNMASDGGMAMRGVTRPMAEQEVRQHQAKMHEEQSADQSKPKDHMQGGQGGQMMHDKHMHSGHMMDDSQRQMMLSMHHKQTLWVYWLVVMLGVWTMLSPLTFSYGVGTVAPSGGREVWLTLSERISAMTWSDIISGALLVILGFRSLTPNRPVSMWICCFVGVWLTMAPILFWAPTAVAYLNDTLVGAFVIALTILIPGMPNMITYMQMGPETPPGWSYNPSSWPQRWIMIALGFAGWLVSRYLAAFQLGYTPVAWDPFFGEGTRQVLNSSMSHSLPISDGGLGSIAYTFEFLMGFMGSPSRWRTMPWMVTFFGILVIPLGLVHIFLVISQPIMVGAWCTLCLAAAGIMLPMLPLEVDEVIAMGQFLVKAKKKGQSLWQAFWKGGTLEEGDMQDERSPQLMSLPWQFTNVYKSSIWGMSFPWTLVVAALLGIWLMASPGVFGVGIQETAADVNHLCGALIVVCSVLAMGEVIRVVRFGNVLLGVAVAALPWFVAGSTMALNISSLVAGLAVVALSIPRGPKTETYGSWDRYVR